VIRDVDVEEFAAVVAEHDEHEQEAKGQGWHEGSDQEMQWRGEERLVQVSPKLAGRTQWVQIPTGEGLATPPEPSLATSRVTGAGCAVYVPAPTDSLSPSPEPGSGGLAVILRVVPPWFQRIAGEPGRLFDVVLGTPGAQIELVRFLDGPGANGRNGGRRRGVPPEQPKWPRCGCALSDREPQCNVVIRRRVV
jgi:hypothetical protein